MSRAILPSAPTNEADAALAADCVADDDPVWWREYVPAALPFWVAVAELYWYAVEPAVAVSKRLAPLGAFHPLRELLEATCVAEPPDLSTWLYVPVAFVL